MYYPMRVVRDKKYKLIWNIAHPLPYPFASDLWAASSWQAQFKKGMDAPYGRKTVGQYIHRAEFELFDIEKDPNELKSVYGQPKYAALTKELKTELDRLRELYKVPDDTRPVSRSKRPKPKKK